jgi:gliding motility-associated-like protein
MTCVLITIIFWRFILPLMVSPCFGQTEPFLWGIHVDGEEFDPRILASVMPIRSTSAPNGDVIITGGIVGNTAKIGNIVIPSPNGMGMADIFVARMTPDGTFKWARRYGGPGSDHGVQVDLDETTGRLYVTAMTEVPEDIQNFPRFIAPPSRRGGYDAVVLCLDGEQGNGIWSYYFDGNTSLDDFCYGLDVDNGNAVYVSGTFSVESGNLYYASLNPATGQPNYVNIIQSANPTVGHIGDQLMYHNGRIYITGTVDGPADFDPGPGQVVITPQDGDSRDMFFACFDAQRGALVWVTQIGTSGRDRGFGIETDNTHLYLTGFVGSGVALVNNAARPMVNSPTNTALAPNGTSISDLFFAKYTLNGELVCARRIGNTGLNVGRSLLLQNKVLYLAGSISGIINIDGVEFTTKGENDILLLQMDKDNCEAICGITAGGLNSDIGFMVVGGAIPGGQTPEAQNAVYVSGNFSSTMSIPNSMTATDGDGFLTKVIFQPPVVGQITGPESICGPHRISLKLADYSGQITYWQQQPNCTGSWQNINSTDATIEVNIRATTCFRAFIQMGQCTSSTVVDTVRLITPNPANAGPDQTVCSDVLSLNGNGVGNWRIVSQPQGANAVLFIGNTTAIQDMDVAGNYVLRWRRIDQPDSCPVQEDEVIITRQIPNPANAGPDQALCVNEVALTVNGQGTWTILSQPGGAIARITNGQNPRLTGMAIEGQYRLRWTRTDQPSSCPPQTDELLITYFQPNSSDAGPDQTICADNTRLTGNAVGVWNIIRQPSGARAVVTGNATAQLTNLSVAGDYTLTWTRTDLPANCPNQPDIITITVQQPNKGEVVRNRIICWDTVQTRSNGIGKWQWQAFPAGMNPQISDSLANQITISQLLTPGFYDLTWTRTDQPSACPDQVDTLSIEVLTDPPANAGPDFTICSNATPLNGNGTGFWTIIDQPDSANSELVLAGRRHRLEALNVIGPYTLRWTRTDIPAICPNGSDDVVITVNQFREAIAGSDQTICVDSTSVTGNGEGTWVVLEAPEPAQVLIEGTPSAKVSRLTAAGAYLLQWQRTDQPVSCPVQVDTLRIQVNQPNSAALGTDTTTCTDSIALNAPGTGRWQVLDQPANAQARWSAVDSSAATLLNLRVVGNYIVQWVRTDQPQSCLPQSDSLQISVVRPLAADAGLDQSVCADTTTVRGNGAGVWSWLSQPDSVNALIDGSLIANISAMTKAGLYRLRWTRTDQPISCPDQIDELLIRVSRLAVDGKVRHQLCSPMERGAIEVWVISERLPIRYRWSDGDSTNPRTNLAPGKYSVTVRDSAGCLGSADFSIRPMDSLKLPIALFRDNLLGDTTLMLPDDVLRLRNESVRATRFIWLWDDTTAANSYDTERTFGRSKSYCVRLVAISADGCADTSEKHCYFVDAPYAVHIPNAFSPNTDGINDRIGAIVVGQLVEFRLQIFSSWGRLVFDGHAHDFWWDGTYDGEPAQEGVYAFLLTARFRQNPGNPVAYKGTITLLR